MIMMIEIMTKMCSLLLPLLRSSSARVVVLSSLAHKVSLSLSLQDTIIIIIARYHCQYYCKYRHHCYTILWLTRCHNHEYRKIP